MSYRALLIAFAIGCAAAADSTAPVFSFSSNSSLGASFSAFPTWTVDSNGVAQCTSTADTGAPYVPIPLNISVAGFYQIGILGDNDMRGSMVAFIFTKTSSDVFNGSTPTPCTSLPYFQQRALTNTFGDSTPRINDVVYLPVGWYDLVVTSDDESSGVFAANIWLANLWGTTVGTANFSAPSGNGDCDFGSEIVNYAILNWTAAANAVVDVWVGFDWNSAFGYGSSNGFYVEAQLYSGAVDVAKLTAQDCTVTNFISQSESQNYGNFLTAFVNLSVTAGTTYSLVVSGGQAGQQGTFGVWVRPTTFMSLAGSWEEPDRAGGPQITACEASGETSVYGIYLFNATASTVLIDTSAAPSGYTDTYSFLYQGVNAPNPVPCPAGANLVFSADTGDVTALVATGAAPGATYTAVVSTYSHSSSPSDTLLWVFSGAYVSPSGVGTSSTSGGVSGASTASAGASTASAGASTASGTNGGSTNNGGSTTEVGAASSVVVSVFALVAAIALLLVA